MKFGLRKRLKKLRRRTARFLTQDSDVMERLADAERELKRNARTLSGMQFLLTIAPTKAPQLFQELARSKSQHWQDLFVLSELDLKRNGYFVEFGATDGVRLSNTHLLEEKYAWKGIVAEPARCWHAALQANRKAHVETRCVWSQSGQMLPFNQTSAPMLSTISTFSDTDFHAAQREHGTCYEVETISLMDMLAKHGAPRTIDYLSIDTEGSEYEILSHFDFDKYRFRIITCEHNHTRQRQKVFELLTANGYERRFEALSRCDDWYVASHEHQAGLNQSGLP